MSQSEFYFPTTLMQTRVRSTEASSYTSESTVSNQSSLVSKKHSACSGDRTPKLSTVNQQSCIDLNQFYGRIFVAASAFFLFQTPSAYQLEVSFKDHAISAIGTVKQTTVESYWVSTGISASYSQTRYRSIVQFETLKGKAVTFSSSSICNSRCKSIQVPILYDPIYPNQARVGTVVNPESVIYGHLMFSAFLALVAKLIFSEAHSQKK